MRRWLERQRKIRTAERSDRSALKKKKKKAKGDSPRKLPTSPEPERAPTNAEMRREMSPSRVGMRSYDYPSAVWKPQGRSSNWSSADMEGVPPPLEALKKSKKRDRDRDRDRERKKRKHDDSESDIIDLTDKPRKRRKHRK